MADGYAAACKAVYAGSIPPRASIPATWGPSPRRFAVRSAPGCVAVGHARRGAPRGSPHEPLRVRRTPVARARARRESKPAPLDDNAYPFALGFLAARAAIEASRRRKSSASCRRGATVVNRRHRQGGKQGPSSARRLQLTGSISGHAQTETRPSALVSSLGLICQPWHQLNCAHRLIATAASLDPNEPQLALLFARYGPC